MNKTIRVLQFPGSLSVGGVGSMLMNIYRNIDKEHYQFDFCVVRDNNREGPFDAEIKENGGKILSLPPIRKIGILKHINTIKRIIKENGPYDAVHVHSIYNGIFIIIVSRFLGVKKRVYHVHNTNDLSLNRIPFHKLFKMFARFIIKTLATNYLACGKEAAKYVYGNKYADNKVLVLNNALDLNQFYAFDEIKVRDIRNKLQIPRDVVVIGNAARFVKIKNQKFLIDLTYEISKKQGVILLLAGDGDTRQECEQYAKELGIIELVKFLGNINDMPKFYNALDIFILPSLFEGLPVSSIEAQACGIPCLQSDTITTESDMGLNLLYSFNLSAELEDVVRICDTIKETKVVDNNLISSTLREKGYAISETVNVIENVYNGIS